MNLPEQDNYSAFSQNIKGLLISLFDLYIKGSLHVSLAVTAFSYITVLLYRLNVPAALYIFIFTATVLSYNFTKYLVLFENKTVLVRGRLKFIAVITVFALAGMVISLVLLDIHVLLFSLLPGLLTAAYALPVFQKGTNLRQVFGIKLLIIGTVWALVTVGLPFIAHFGANQDFSIMIVEGLQRLLFVMVITLPFDIRDVQADSRRLGTIPQIFGIKKTKLIGSGILLSVFLIEIFQSPVFTYSFWIFLLVLCVTGILVWKSMVVQPKYFASFWVEGIPVAWAALLILAI